MEHTKIVCNWNEFHSVILFVKINKYYFSYFPTVYKCSVTLQYLFVGLSGVGRLTNSDNRHTQTVFIVYQEGSVV